MRDYDVVIVGGRPAGATLAARLGRRGLRVLVVDRADFPSLPGVPSSPALHQGAMRLLDELGIDESLYGMPEARMRSLDFDFKDYFSATLHVPKVWGRDYLYGIDRRQFDLALWENLAKFPAVTRKSGFTVTDLVRDKKGCVVGITGHEPDAASRDISAGCVVGADGRFSFVARKAGAQVVQEEKEIVSTVYYADWQGVPQRSPDDANGYIYITGRGFDVPCFRMPGSLLSVNLHVRSDRVELGGDTQGYYQSMLKSQAPLWRRLSAARQVSEVVGLKRIGNGYRRAAGAGWVLVGDALHYKDPVDAQGIYDALLETKLLDTAIADWHSGARRFEQAMAEYEVAVSAATGLMFEQTIARLRRDLYQEPPLLLVKTLMRWLLSDPGYHERFVQYVARALPDGRLMTPALIAGAVLRGIGRDVRDLLRSRGQTGLFRAG